MISIRNDVWHANERNFLLLRIINLSSWILCICKGKLWWMRVDFDFLNNKFQTNENTNSRVALCFRIKGQLKQIIRLRWLVDLFFLTFVKIRMNFCFLLPNGNFVYLQCYYCLYYINAIKTYQVWRNPEIMYGNYFRILCTISLDL